MTQIINGLSWLSLGRGTFASPRFKRGHQAMVAGERGAWDWVIEHRPPEMRPYTFVAQGKEPTKLAAMLAAQNALKIAEMAA